MAEFVKKTDGSKVALIRKRPIPLDTRDGIVGYVRNFSGSPDSANQGHFVNLTIGFTNEEIARAAGFSPYIRVGNKIRITAVEPETASNAVPEEDPYPKDDPDVLGDPAELAFSKKITNFQRKLETILEEREALQSRIEELEGRLNSTGEKKDEEDYEDDPEGPPPIIPPTSEPGPAEEQDKQYDEDDPERGKSLERFTALKKWLGL